jgi:hypothetical protein
VHVYICTLYVERNSSGKTKNWSISFFNYLKAFFQVCGRVSGWILKQDASFRKLGWYCGHKEGLRNYFGEIFCQREISFLMMKQRTLWFSEECWKWSYHREKIKLQCVQNPNHMDEENLYHLRRENSWYFSREKNIWNKRPLSLKQTVRLSLPLVFTLVSCSPYSSTVKMKAICSPETSVDFQRTTRRCIPEDSTLQ